MSLIIKAAQFADAAHRNQWRRDTINGIRVPYIRHVGRVAARVSTLDDVTEDMIAAAWLHDVIEDCGITEAIIAHLFNTTVAKYVNGLTSYTKRPQYKDAYKAHNRSVRVTANNGAYAQEPLEVHRIKCCDRIDNLTDTLLKANTEFALRYIDETKDLMKYLDPKYPLLVWEIQELINAIKSKYTQKEVNEARNDLQADIYG
jgi:(p)ppGpp synthase/HD superfamily hydrolase